MLAHPITNFEIQRYCQNKPEFHAVYSRNNLPKLNNRTQVINLDEFKPIETHWIILYGNGDNVIYFDSFGVEHIPKEI